jgi:hypothetical protein
MAARRTIAEKLEILVQAIERAVRLPGETNEERRAAALARLADLVRHGLVRLPRRGRLHRCGALTLGGKPCRARAIPGAQHCAAHGGEEPKLPAGTGLVEMIVAERQARRRSLTEV